MTLIRQAPKPICNRITPPTTLPKHHQPPQSSIPQKRGPNRQPPSFRLNNEIERGEEKHGKAPFANHPGEAEMQITLCDSEAYQPEGASKRAHEDVNAERAEGYLQARNV